MCNDKVQQNSSVTSLKTAPQHAITIPKASENLCNSNLVLFCFLITKTIKDFNDTKYCTFHRSVIRFSFSNLSYKSIYILWQSKQTSHYKKTFPKWKKKIQFKIFVFETFASKHHFGEKKLLHTQNNSTVKIWRKSDESVKEITPL